MLKIDADLEISSIVRLIYWQLLFHGSRPTEIRQKRHIY